eukprot:TRINITY_DN2676_c0_g2_i1.p1 TRINITY_DN2676_c0_g2~~TRINITY_DN2676_c0_g2_i1.p1  ORF type:complete len:585 (+),score=200.10 TRINITY_DN2676_c0_g2_i1:81-1835(+)
MSTAPRRNLVSWQRKPTNNTGLSTDIKIVSGRIHPSLANAVAKHLKVDHFSAKVEDFSNGETSVTITESVREADVFIIQPTAIDPNNALMELLALSDAARRASARRVTAVIPCFGYARSDKQERTRTPVSAKLVARMLEAAGINRILTMDLHSNQIQGFFNIPVDNILMEPFMIEHVKKNVPEARAMVSPGVSCVHLAKRVADGLRCPLAIIHFGQLHPGQTKDAALVSSSGHTMKLVGDVRGKVAVLLEDLADSCTTLVEMARYLIEQGASRVHAITSHGILSGDAVRQIDASPICEFVVTDSVPIADKHAVSNKLHVISIAPLLAESIRRIHNGESITYLYQQPETSEMQALIVDDDPQFVAGTTPPAVPAATAGRGLRLDVPRPRSPGNGPLRSMSMLEPRTMELALEKSGLSSPVRAPRPVPDFDSRIEEVREVVARQAATFAAAGQPTAPTPSTGQQQQPPAGLTIVPRRLSVHAAQFEPGSYGSSPTANAAALITAFPVLMAQPAAVVVQQQQQERLQSPQPSPSLQRHLHDSAERSTHEVGGPDRPPGLMKLLDSTRDIHGMMLKPGSPGTDSDGSY